MNPSSLELTAELTLDSTLIQTHTYLGDLLLTNYLPKCLSALPHHFTMCLALHLPAPSRVRGGRGCSDGGSQSHCPLCLSGIDRFSLAKLKIVAFKLRLHLSMALSVHGLLKKMLQNRKSVQGQCGIAQLTHLNSTAACGRTNELDQSYLNGVHVTEGTLEPPLLVPF